MTEILKTQNKTWGFWGTASNHIEHKQEMQAFWDKAAEIIQSKGLTQQQTLGLMDSRWGRHIADEFAEELSTNLETFASVFKRQMSTIRLIKEFRWEKVRKNNGDRLSGGERRRTEIARCLAIDPKFIMLDEPFAGVDPIAVEDIQKIVWDLKKRNIGILITDHNVQETLSITSRAYLLFEGRILFQGTPEELSVNQVVREKYLGSGFVLRRKDFMV